MKRLMMLAWLLVPGAAAAQTESFIVRAGNDTIAVENFTLTAARLQGELSGRGMPGRLRYAVDLKDGVVAAMRFEAIDAGSDTASLRADITFAGDSAFARVVQRGVQQPEQRVASANKAIPYINLAPTFLELALRSTRRAVGDTSTITYFNVGNAALFPAHIKWTAADSAVMNVANVEIRLHVDAQGRLLHASVPAQNVTMERVSGAVRMGALKPDYSAPANAHYTAEDVTIRTDEGHVLAGTLTLPKQRTGAVPVVITISGSGPQDRDETLAIVPGYRPFREIAEALAARGVAVLRYDDRGTGSSTGDFSEATSKDLVNNVKALIRYVRQRNEIEHDAVFLLGHSEGAMLAPLVAAEDDRLAGIVLLAAPAYPGRKILEYQNRRLLEQDASLSAVARDSILQSRLASIDSAEQPWLRFFRDYDPLPVLRRVRVPVLVVQGATDRQVTAEQAELVARELQAGGNSRVALHVLPDVNHLFLSDPSGDVAGYSSLRNRNLVPELLQLIGDWIVKHSQ